MLIREEIRSPVKMNYSSVLQGPFVSILVAVSCHSFLRVSTPLYLTFHEAPFTVLT